MLDISLNIGLWSKGKIRKGMFADDNIRATLMAFRRNGSPMVEYFQRQINSIYTVTPSMEIQKTKGSMAGSR